MTSELGNFSYSGAILSCHCCSNARAISADLHAVICLQSSVDSSWENIDSSYKSWGESRDNYVLPRESSNASPRVNIFVLKLSFAESLPSATSTSIQIQSNGKVWQGSDKSTREYYTRNHNLAFTWKLKLCAYALGGLKLKMFWLCSRKYILEIAIYESKLNFVNLSRAYKIVKFITWKKFSSLATNQRITKILRLIDGYL